MNELLGRVLAGLEDVGYGQETRKTAERLYGAGLYDELVKHLRKCRCSLMDDLHQSQKKVDCMDYLIRQIEKESEKERKDGITL